MSSMPLIRKPVAVNDGIGRSSINRDTINQSAVNRDTIDRSTSNRKNLVVNKVRQDKDKIRQNKFDHDKSNQGCLRQTAVPQINANFSVPVIIESNLLDWSITPAISTTVLPKMSRATPMSGVRQHCFEHVINKKTRLTSLLKFSAGRSFKKFGHESGEEFLVLSGVFSDAGGDYGAGYYVRNPPGTTHAPYTRHGCIVLFKLGQFQALDNKRVRINTLDSVARWRAAGEPGVSCMDLHQFSEEQVHLYRIRSECWITFKPSRCGLEIFVCEGYINVKDKCYATGCWLRYPAGSKIKVSSMGGACLYVKQSIFVN